MADFVPVEAVREETYVPVEALSDDGSNWERIGYQTLGGMVGGAVASPSVVGTPAGIGLGSGIGGQVYDLKEELLGRKAPKPLLERSVGAAEDVMFDVVSPAALSKGIYAAKKIGGAVINKPVSKLFRPSDMAAYGRVGVKPTAATATQSRALGVMENALADFPVSAGPMQRSAQHNIEQLKFANEYLAKEFGENLTKEETGALLKTAAPKAIERLDKVYGKLFGLVSKRISDVPQEVKNTRNMLQELLKESERGPSSGIASIASDVVAKAKASGGGLPFNSLKKFRTKVGKMLKEPGLVSNRDIVSGDLKRLYGALTLDMETAALKAGPKAHANWRAANKYYELSLQKKLPVLEEIIKKGYDEEAFNVLMKSAKVGGSRLRMLRKQMSQEEWGAVAGNMLKNLGRANPGAQNASGEMFSVSTFLTRWNQLAPEAKKAVWGGTRYKQLWTELDEFTRVAGDFKAVESLANRSRTGSVLMFFSLFQTLGATAGGVAGGPLGAVGGMAVMGTMTVAPYATARLMTNPGFVRWLSRGVKIAKANPQAMSTHLGRLFMLREREDIEDEVSNLIDVAFRK